MSEDLVSDLLTMLGEDGFIRLCEAHGGLRLYIPADPTRSELSATIGLDNATRLSNQFRGGYIEVPLGRAQRALSYRDSGASNREIAKRLGMTEGGVVQLFARIRRQTPAKVKAKGDPRQIDMFE